MTRSGDGPLGTAGAAEPASASTVPTQVARSARRALTCFIEISLPVSSSGGRGIVPGLSGQVKLRHQIETTRQPLGRPIGATTA